MTKRIRRAHKLSDSALYSLSSKRRLAEVLLTDRKRLCSIAREAGRLYRSWQQPKKNGESRTIEAPFENLKALQRRIGDLLQRIETPPYLFSPARGRSYIDNAARHRGAESFRHLDVEDFFPSCTSRRVAWFFTKVMRCSPDVAAILCALTTRHGHLPQGSPASPILAYFAYYDMWDEIATLPRQADCQLSLYADDITISGPIVRGDMVWHIKRALNRNGLRLKTEKEHALVHRPADVTGVIVRGAELILPNRQHLKQKVLRDALDITSDESERETIMNKLRGHRAQTNQILKRNAY